MVDLRWSNEVKLSDILTMGGWLLTIIGLVFTALQIRRAARTQRYQFLLTVTERYFGDKEVREFYYRLDYHKFTFDPKTFLGTEDERLLDGIIYNLDIIGRMLRMNVLSLHEVSIIGFQVSRVMGNPEVQRYLAWLDGEYRREGRPTPAHDDARYLAKSLGK
jgi:hypothetical protein